MDGPSLVSSLVNINCLFKLTFLLCYSCLKVNSSSSALYGERLKLDSMLSILITRIKSETYS